MLVACGAPQGELQRPPRSARPPVPVLPQGPQRLAASVIAQVPAGTFGPYLGMRHEGGLAVWASTEGDTRSWFARSVSAHGEALGEPVRLTEAPSRLGLVTVRPLREGFALLSTHQTSDGEVVELAVLSDAGRLLYGPTSVGRTATSLLWVEAFPSAEGASVLWAASGAGRAEVWTADMTAKAELTGSPRLLARDAGAWQAVRFGSGVALAITRLGKGNTHGPIELRLLRGAEVPTPLIINDQVSADLDLDMAPLGERLVLAWSDHRGGENRVFSAVVDSAGKLVASAGPATPPLGEQALLRVVPPADGSPRAYLAWESLDAQLAAHRSFQISEINDNGRVSSPRGVVEYWKMDGSMPEIAASPTGLAVLTLAPLCQGSSDCSPSSPIAPQYVVFDDQFAVRVHEPLWSTGAVAPASLAWNLTCPNPSCFALIADTQVPSSVSLMHLASLTGAFRAPAQRVELGARPRVVGDEALAETDPLAQVALTETSNGMLLGWLTDFDPTTPWVKLKQPTADGRFEPLRARLELQAFGGKESSAAASPAETLSLRAHSLGGIALSGSRQSKETLAAWAGLDGGQPQVFLTLLDKSGKKLNQRMLTHKNGDLNDVAVTASGADYLLAWVDERSGDPELYATKVNHTLNRIAAEQRITEAPGSATDVSLVSTKAGALLVWADARESELPGSADIYAAVLRGSDAGRVGNDICLQKTRSHSFAPVARAYGNGALVAWLEGASEQASGEPAHVSLAVLDDAGRLQGTVQSVEIGEGTPVSLGLDCTDLVCHVLVSVEESSRGALYALDVAEGRASPAVRIRSSMSPPSSVAPLVHGTYVYLSETRQKRARLRRLQLEW